MLPSVQPNEGQDADMKKVIINRKFWGKHRLRSAIDLKQCCLGFVCAAYEVPQDDMLGKGLPSDLPRRDKKLLPKWLMEHLTKDADVDQAVTINDSLMSWAKKEEKLKPIFKKRGIQLIFRGKRS